MAEPLLTTENLTVGYRTGRHTTALLSNLNLCLHAGSLTALLGQNGIGKSTLLRALCGSEKPIAGRVLLQGHDALSIPLRQRARIVGLVTTERTSAGALTVAELTALGRQPYTGFLGHLRQHDRQAATAAMQAVGIEHLANAMVAQLSDGERQKAMIARALAQQTPIIVLDEPTAFLDTASRIEVMQLLRKVAHNNHCAVLLSTHDISQALQMADNIWLINANRQLIAAPTATILAGNDMNSLFSTDKLRFNPTLLDFQPVD